MYPRGLRITNNQIELIVIRLLRSGADGMLPDNPAFAELGVRARRQGLAIRSGGGRDLSLDEIRLLACLAGRQRKKRAQEDIAADLDESLHRCVAVLNERGIRLPFRSIQRHDFIREQRLPYVASLN